jgi:hypothetical protein
MAEFGSISKPGMDACLSMPNNNNEFNNINETSNVGPDHAPDMFGAIPAPEAGRMESDAAEAVAIERPKTKCLEQELKCLESPFLNPMSGMESVTVVDNTVNTDITETTKEKEIFFVFSAELSSDPGELKTLKQAINGKDKSKWIPLVRSKFMSLLAGDCGRKSNGQK